MKTYRQEAEVQRILLQAEVASVPDVIKWADDLIAAMDAPDDALIDLSLSGERNQKEIERQLWDLATGCDRVAAVRTAIPKLIEALDADRSHTSTIAFALHDLAIQCSWEFPDDLTFINGIDGEIDLTGNATESEWRSLLEELKKANNTSEGIRQPADGLPKPSM
jgi:hypothetical protein